MDNQWGVPREGARAQEEGEESTRERVRRGLDNRWGVPREGARAQERGEESTREGRHRAREGETLLGQSMGRTKGGR